MTCKSEKMFYRRDEWIPEDFEEEELTGGFFLALTWRRKSYGANPEEEMPESDVESCLGESDYDFPESPRRSSGRRLRFCGLKWGV